MEYLLCPRYCAKCGEYNFDKKIPENGYHNKINGCKLSVIVETKNAIWQDFCFLQYEQRYYFAN